jgi:FolB domain-containing protein
VTSSSSSDFTVTLERIIEIRGLAVMAHVGVPEQERKYAQRLLIDLRFAAVKQPEKLQDDLALTVDYDALSRRVNEIVEESSYRLIETLADELISVLMKEFFLRWMELTIRKFILPQTEWVSVSVRSMKDEGSKSPGRGSGDR